jgi:hypothetical protein
MTSVAQLTIEYLDASERLALAMTFTAYRDHLEEHGAAIDETVKARRWLVDGHYLAWIEGDKFALSGKGMELLRQYRERQPDGYFERLFERIQRGIDV